MISPMPTDGTIQAFAPFSFAPPPAAADTTAEPSHTHAWKDGGFSFHDVLDTINPLQHIPLIGSLYRWLTGDEPGNVARIAGDTLFGGPIGLATGLFSVAFEEETGKDPGEMVIAALTGADTAPAKTAAEPAAATASSTKDTGSDPTPAVAVAKADAPHETAPKITAAATSAPAPVVPDHPPIPLHPTAAPTVAKAAAASGAAEHRFLAQRALFQRSVGRHFSTSGRPITPPVPLQLTGQVVPGAGRRIPPGLIVPPPGLVEAAAQTAPVDIPQRMMDALDKYKALHQQRGTALDLTQ